MMVLKRFGVVDFEVAMADSTHLEQARQTVLADLQATAHTLIDQPAGRIDFMISRKRWWLGDRVAWELADEGTFIFDLENSKIVARISFRRTIFQSAALLGMAAAATFVWVGWRWGLLILPLFYGAMFYSRGPGRIEKYLKRLASSA